MRFTVTPCSDLKELEVADSTGTLNTGLMDQQEQYDQVREMITAAADLLPEGCDHIERMLDDVIEEMELVD